MAQKACMGVVEIGGVPAVIGELFNWRVRGQSEPIDVSVMGECKRASLGGPTGYEFSGSCYYEPSDAGQLLIVEGAESVAIVIYPLGNMSGQPQWTMSANILEREDSAEVDGAVQMTFRMADDGTGLDRTGTVP